MVSISDARGTISTAIDNDDGGLRALNLDIHSHPETAYEERHAHDAICAFLEARGFTVKRHTYGLETSFEATVGQGGRLVVFCAEYDALPGIGHGCGHNLIATSSIAAFVGLATAVVKAGVAGRVRLLGTPAEEGGGGKAKLIDAGAFDDDIVGAIMAHPASQHMFQPGFQGIAGFRTIASHKLRVEYHGRGAHAGGEPWKGLNALDAAVAAYNGISMLRQHIKPDERIHGVIEKGGEVPNVIPHYTRMNWYVRSPTVASGDLLLARVKACLEAAATTAGCTMNYIFAPTYEDLLIVDSLCAAYSDEMAALGRSVQVKQIEAGTISTDMGNVSHKIPSFHGVFGIPCDKDVPGHDVRFAAAAEKGQAHTECVLSGKAMAMLGWKLLTDDAFAAAVRRDFEEALEKAAEG
ncbi:hypothetical protein A1O3_07331 [Capronia epimyces CBS 606.96]|uniref:Peptidase M20 domain-containing protein 2 n=1 Tax=Capronia epimyces CBS 606.96 TaxID=1182542 RepID=W9XLF9_9EURO|nr:uncharacterized protein A1O3_07331 [Capronia epimyces CBS 606.96]EXJ81043.1 hypothetical protein A1O3_07331 [Capronia epimyces CBS 606.96]